MAIIENRVTEIGDVLYIKAEVPIIGLTVLIDFVDTVGGETMNRYFYKEFRYSKDGINFYPWKELTNPNVSQISVNPSDIFVVEYRYTRIGTDPSDDLEFSDVTLRGDFTQFSCGTAFSNSIFSQFFSCQDVQVLAWAINVLEKCYKNGIVPTYIERGSDNFEDDQDYITFWRTFTTFFAYIVVYARKFQDFGSVPELLKDYLQQRGMFICPDEDQLQELIYMKENFYREISRRGTLSMLREQSDTSPIDGELLRMICKGGSDEFIFALIDSQNSSWCINNSSPVWKGVNSQKHINKSWEDLPDFVDLSYIPVVGSVSLETDGDKSVIKMQGDTAGQVNGIGANPSIPSSIDLSAAIPVSTNVNYKITFQIRQPGDLYPNFTFGVICLDDSGNVYQCKDITSGNVTPYFFARKKLNKSDTYYFVEGILYNVQQNLLSLVDGTCNIGFGTDLRFGSKKITKIIPFILTDTDGSVSGDSSLYLWDLKITPYDTEYSTGIVQSTNIIKMWYLNRNSSLENDQVESNIKRFMIPYSSNLKATEISRREIQKRVPPFQYAVVRYTWNEFSGENFNMRTGIIDTNSPLDGQEVGWLRNMTIGSGPTPNFYLEWAGDNISEQGVEAVLVNFIKLSQDLPSESEFKVRLRGLFTGTLLTGDIQIELVTYSGGVMQKVGTDFVNVGGSEVGRITISKTLTTESSIDTDGEDLGEITYFPSTGTALLTTS